MAGRLFEVHTGPEGEVVFRFRPRRLRGVSREAREHLRRSAVEFLLAFRTFIDDAVRRLEGEEEQRPRRRRIEVQAEEEKGEK